MNDFAVTFALVMIGAAPSTSELLGSAKQLFDQLEYDQVLPVARTVLARTDATLEQKLDAYVLEASCLAIVGDPIEAEQPFRLLLRARPEFTMPKSTPPKILAVFTKVQSEERALYERLQAFERQQLVESIAFEGGAPVSVAGGQPLPIHVTIRDPRGGVHTANVFYRRAGEERYASLPLDSCPSGWCAEIPSAWTVSQSGFLLEYWIATEDREGGQLATFGAASKPRSVSVDAGEISRGAAFYETWWFWTIVGVAVVGGGAATTYALTRGPEIPATDLGEVPYR